jgi:hypothetical protein
MTAYVKRFLAPLRVEFVDGKTWVVMDTFEFRLGSLQGAEFVRIGKGFETDFASIPRGLWNLWPPAGGKYTPAALVHDCVYKTGFVSVDDGSVRHVTRAEADDIFKDAMEVAGVGWLSRHLIYRGVRLGGRGAWNKHRKAADDRVE